jgi:hypothetical protein
MAAPMATAPTPAPAAAAHPPDSRATALGNATVANHRPTFMVLLGCALRARFSLIIHLPLSP